MRQQTWNIIEEEKGSVLLVQQKQQPTSSQGKESKYTPLDILHEESYPALRRIRLPTRACLDYGGVTGGVQLGQVFLARDRQGQILKGLEGYRHLQVFGFDGWKEPSTIIYKIRFLPEMKTSYYNKQIETTSILLLEYYRQKRAWLALYQMLFQMQSSYKLLVFLSMDQRCYSVKKHSRSSHLAAEDWHADSLSVGEGDMRDWVLLNALWPMRFSNSVKSFSHLSLPSTEDAGWK